MIHKLLSDKKVILASASPRRKLIFDLIGIKALQVPAKIDETIHDANPAKIVKDHAREKVRYVSNKYDPECVIVGADTVVYHNQKILGKPRDHYQAAEFLSQLSGDSHYVYTAVAIYYKNTIYCDFIRSKVEFNPLSALEIDAYIATGEPLDKAGAYGIQGFGSQFIRKITGCYFNVMGFPVFLFYQMLKKIFL